MTKADDLRSELEHLAQPRWPAYLSEHSGLPGPRGNLELMQAVADVGDRDMFDRLIASDDTYLTACGVVGLGTLLATGDLRSSLGCDSTRAIHAGACGRPSRWLSSASVTPTCPVCWR